jgi:hypothetical protein
MTKLFVNTAKDWLKVNGATDFLLTDVEVPYVVPEGYPVTPAWRDATITSFSPTLVSITNSLKRQARSRGAHAWGIELRYPAMTRASFAPLWAFLTNLAGQSTTFLLSLPAYTPLGTGAGSPMINGAAVAGFTVVTDGWGGSQTVLKAGDWLQIEGDLKVYMATANVTSDPSGNASISLYPALRRIPADNATISVAPYFTCALSSDILTVDFDQCVKARGFSVDLVEAQ